MDSINILIRNFKGPEIRFKTLNAIYEKLLEEAYFPYTCVEALDILRKRLFRQNSKRLIGIVAGKYHLKTKPSHFYEYRLKKKMRYQLRLFQKLYNIGTYNVDEIKNQVMDVSVKIMNIDSVVIYTKLDDISRIFVKRASTLEGIIEEEIHDCVILERKRFRRSVGVGIRKTEKLGKITLGGKRFNFGAVHGNSYVLFFFDKGRAYFFDPYGKRLELAVSAEEEMHRRYLRKLERVQKQFNSKKSYSTEAKKFMKALWLTQPDTFSGKGRRLLIEGSTRYVTDSNGFFQFQHYDGIKTKTIFYVGEKYPSTVIDFSWKGPNILIHADKDLLNAYELTTPGIDTINPGKIDNLVEVIAIRNLTKLEQPQIALNNVRYHFSKMELLKYIKHFKGNEALMLHLSPNGLEARLLIQTPADLKRYESFCKRTGLRSRFLQEVVESIKSYRLICKRIEYKM